MYRSAVVRAGSAVLLANTATQITLIATGPLFSGEKPRLFPGARSPRIVTATRRARGNAAGCAPRAISANRLSQRVEYLLHVFVLLELVDKREDFCGLLFG